MKLNTLKEIYDLSLSRMQSEPDYWKGFLEYASNMYAYEFYTLASLYVQNQELTQLASYEMWNKKGYHIRQGEKSIPALMNNRFGMAHMFDLSQLSEKPRVTNWHINDTEREWFEQRFLEANSRYGQKNFSDTIGLMIVEQMNTVVRPREKKYEEILIKNGNMIFDNVIHMVEYRCNSKNVGPVHNIENLNNNQIAVVGRYIMNICRPILLSCKEIERQIRKENEHEHNRDGLRRKERNTVRSGDRGAGTEVHQTIREIRNVGQEVLGGEQADRDAGADSSGNDDEDNASNRRESQPEDGTIGESIIREESDKESRKYSASDAASSEHSRPGGRNRTERDSIQIELDLEPLQSDNIVKKGVEMSAPFFDTINYHYEDSHNLYEGGLNSLPGCRR